MPAAAAWIGSPNVAEILMPSLRSPVSDVPKAEMMWPSTGQTNSPELACETVSFGRGEGVTYSSRCAGLGRGMDE